MNVLVINAGSSSLKFQILEMPSGHVFLSGIVERIGLDHTQFHYVMNGNKENEFVPFVNHKEALYAIAAKIQANGKTIDTIVHRVVHGGEQFSKTTLITLAVKNKIRDLSALAPLHNPANLACIEVAELVFPKAKQVAVFDTAFHQTIPEKAYRYAIPTPFYEVEKIRQYGFHGTSHKYVSKQAISYLKLPTSKIITIHLGNGCSMTAVKDGKSIDHSMGYGPINGLIMGTRSGDIDQAIIFYMMDNLGYTSQEVQEILQKESGMKGLTGYSDLREIEEQAGQGNEMCQLALEMNAYRVKKLIGAYVAVLNGLDALVFTAGIGENSSLMRALICSDLDFLGIKLDHFLNVEQNKTIRNISEANSSVPILVIPTNEEFEMAEQAFTLLN